MFEKCWWDIQFKKISTGRDGLNLILFEWIWAEQTKEIWWNEMMNDLGNQFMKLWKPMVICGYG